MKYEITAEEIRKGDHILWESGSLEGVRLVEYTADKDGAGHADTGKHFLLYRKFPTIEKQFAIITSSEYDGSTTTAFGFWTEHSKHRILEPEWPKSIPLTNIIDVVPVQVLPIDSLAKLETALAEADAMGLADRDYIHLSRAVDNLLHGS